jgi:hypothetical protein
VIVELETGNGGNDIFVVFWILELEASGMMIEWLADDVSWAEDSLPLVPEAAVGPATVVLFNVVNGTDKDTTELLVDGAEPGGVNVNVPAVAVTEIVVNDGSLLLMVLLVNGAKVLLDNAVGGDRIAVSVRLPDAGILVIEVRFSPDCGDEVWVEVGRKGVTVTSNVLLDKLGLSPVGPMDAVPFDVGRGRGPDDSVFVAVVEPLSGVRDSDTLGVVAALTVLSAGKEALWLPEPVAPILEVLFPPGYGAVELTPIWVVVDTPLSLKEPVNGGNVVEKDEVERVSEILVGRATVGPVVGVLLGFDKVGNTVEATEELLGMVMVEDKLTPLLEIPMVELLTLPVKLDIPVWPNVKLELLTGNGAVLSVPETGTEAVPEESELGEIPVLVETEDAVEVLVLPGKVWPKLVKLPTLVGEAETELYVEVGGIEEDNVEVDTSNDSALVTETLPVDSGELAVAAPALEVTIIVPFRVMVAVTTIPDEMVTTVIVSGGIVWPFGAPVPWPCEVELMVLATPLDDTETPLGICLDVSK